MKKRAILVKEADKWFSLYIRLSNATEDGYVFCCTCNQRLPWRESECGHWQKRGIAPTRWMEDNCDPQCFACNNLKDGEEEKHREYIIKRRGLGVVKYIERVVTEDKMSLTKVYSYEIEAIAEYYKKKVKELSWDQYSLRI